MDVPPLNETLPDAYRDLRELARRFLSRERSDHTLQPTALVHEAYLRLLRDSPESSREASSLLRKAASAMRRVLVDHARRKGAGKRGGERKREPLTDAVLMYQERALDLVALDEALTRLEEMDPISAELVELRFFGGLTEEETAEALSVSSRTVRRGLFAARLWLRRELFDDE